MSDTVTGELVGVTLTDRAARRILAIAAAPDAAGTALRVSVEGGGCSGFQYKFDMTPTRDAEDVVLERNGARVYIDPVSMSFLKGAEIDFVDELMGAAFRVKNPNATASCGCGTSFTI